MAKQFYQHYFSIGDIGSSDYFESHNPPFLQNDKALVIVSTEGGILERMVGIEADINEEDNGGFAPSFLGVNKSCPSFSIQIACINKRTMRAEMLTPDEMFYLNKYLFKDYYRPFKVYGMNFNDNNSNEQILSWSDVIYYVIFTSLKQYNVSNGRGYFEATIRLDSPCAYSPQVEVYQESEGDCLSFYIDAKFNVGDYIYPDIQFKLFYGSGDVTITNFTTNQRMTFHNVPKNNVIYCYNEGYKYVQNQTDSSAYSMGMLDPNSEWIALVDGRNVIEVYVSGTNGLEANFIYQNKIAIQ